MTEAAVSTKLRVALASLGAVCWKVSDRFHASRPDLFFAFAGDTSFIEMKIWPNYPTAAQTDTLNELAAVGIVVYLGYYDKALKTYSVTDWITHEKVYFSTDKEAAKWLLEQRS